MAAPKGNKFALGNNGGRPPIYDDAEKLTEKVIEYFDYIEGEYETEKRQVKEKNEEGKTETVTKEVKVWVRYPEDPTITGLCLYLGFSSKNTLYEYAKKEEFKDSIKRALLIVENTYETKLKNANVAGVIFALKNMGWEDKQKVETKQMPAVKIKGMPQDEVDEMLKEE